MKREKPSTSEDFQLLRPQHCHSCLGTLHFWHFCPFSYSYSSSKEELSGPKLNRHDLSCLLSPGLPAPLPRLQPCRNVPIHRIHWHSWPRSTEQLLERPCMKGSQAHKNVLYPQPETLFPSHTLEIRVLSLSKDQLSPRKVMKSQERK